MHFSSSSSLPTWKLPRTCEDLLLDLQATQLEKVNLFQFLYPCKTIRAFWKRCFFFQFRKRRRREFRLQSSAAGEPYSPRRDERVPGSGQRCPTEPLEFPHPSRSPPASFPAAAGEGSIYGFTGTTEHRAGRPLARLEALPFCGLHGRRLSELHGRARTAGPGRARGEAADEDGASWCARLDAKDEICKEEKQARAAVRHTPRGTHTKKGRVWFFSHTFLEKRISHA